MCDTFVALPGATTTGTTLLAKSADTEVNECQVLKRLPARDWPDPLPLQADRAPRESGYSHLLRERRQRT